MSRLAWNSVGNRLFESGVDRGVLYTLNNVGIAWNGLISVKEANGGGEAKPYFLDGEKYLNISTREEFSGTIEAFTYPDEFGIHDGTFALSTGLIAQQQRRRAFGFSYRTRLGDDLLGTERGYKLHLVYEAMAEPSAKSYTSIGSNVDPMNFSWAFSTKAKNPRSAAKLAPMAHVVIDSTKTNPTLLRYLEEQLYGTDLQQARLVPIDELFSLFEKTRLIYSIIARPFTGLNLLGLETDYEGDVYGEQSRGYFTLQNQSRLKSTGVNGFYTLGITVDSSGLTEDTSDNGMFVISAGAFVEDLPTDPGTYLTNPELVREDPNDPGTYIAYYYTPPVIPAVAGLIVNPNEDGTYIIVDNALIESPSEQGVYIVNSDTVKNNPNESGTYLY